MCVVTLTSLSLSLFSAMALHHHHQNTNITTTTTPFTTQVTSSLQDEKTSSHQVINHQEEDDSATEPVRDDFQQQQQQQHLQVERELPAENDPHAAGLPKKNDFSEPMQERVGGEPLTDDSDEPDDLNEDMDQARYGDECYARGSTKNTESDVREEEPPMTNEMREISCARSESVGTNDEDSEAGQREPHMMVGEPPTEPTEPTLITDEPFPESVKQLPGFTDDSFTVRYTVLTKQQFTTFESSTTETFNTEAPETIAEEIRDDPIRLDDPEELQQRSSSSPYSDDHNLPSVCCTALLGDLHHLSVYTPSAAPPTEETAGTTDDGLYSLSAHHGSASCTVEEGLLNTVKVYCLPSLPLAPAVHQSACEIDERSTENAKLMCCLSAMPSDTAAAPPIACAAVVDSYTTHVDDHTQAGAAGGDDGTTRLTGLYPHHHHTHMTQDSYTTQGDCHTQVEEGEGHPRGLTELHHHTQITSEDNNSIGSSPPPATPVQFTTRLRGKRGN